MYKGHSTQIGDSWTPCGESRGAYQGEEQPMPSMMGMEESECECEMPSTSFKPSLQRIALHHKCCGNSSECKKA